MVQTFPYMADADFRVKTIDIENINIEIHRDVFDNAEDEFLRLQIQEWRYMDCPPFVCLDGLEYGDKSLLPGALYHKIQGYIEGEKILVLRILDQDGTLFHIVAESMQVQ